MHCYQGSLALRRLTTAFSLIFAIRSVRSAPSPRPSESPQEFWGNSYPTCSYNYCMIPALNQGQCEYEDYYCVCRNATFVQNLAFCIGEFCFNDNYGTVWTGYGAMCVDHGEPGLVLNGLEWASQVTAGQSYASSTKLSPSNTVVAATSTSMSTTLQSGSESVAATSTPKTSQSGSESVAATSTSTTSQSGSESVAATSTTSQSGSQSGGGTGGSSHGLSEDQIIAIGVGVPSALFAIPAGIVAIFQLRKMLKSRKKPEQQPPLLSSASPPQATEIYHHYIIESKPSQEP